MMFERRMPIFTKGRILKNEMLELMRDYPRNVVEIFLASRSDGVIAGFDLNVDKASVIISRGIVKYQGEILVLDEVLNVPYEADGSEQVLKLRFGDHYQTSDFAGRGVSVVLERGVHQEDEMEIARFNLSKGAYLRSDYQDFDDFRTAHNTLNIVNQPYSSVSGQTLSPVILRYFARALLQYRTEHAHDLAIVYQVLNQEVSVSRELLANYVKVRLKDEGVRVESNGDLHQGLGRVLKKAKAEQREGGKMLSGGRKLIVE